MVSHEEEFRAFLAELPSTDRYVKFLHDIADTSSMNITPESLRSDNDIEAFARKLTPKYSAKSVSNYRSVMRRYVEMVSTLKS